MNFFLIPLWILIGSGLAFLILQSQRWSVFTIKPEKPKISKLLVVGGAIIRWLVIAVIFIAAAYNSTGALLTVFLSFMSARIVILSVWQKSFSANDNVQKYKG